jgi:hypothetical protein
VLVANFYTGVTLNNSLDSAFYDLFLWACNYGINLVTDITDTRFFWLDVQFCTIGFYMQNGANVSVYGGLFQANSNIGIQVSVEEVAFHGCWFEGNNGGVNGGVNQGGDIVFDVSNESSTNILQILNVAFHNARASASGTMQFLRNSSTQNPSTYANVKFHDCAMVGTTLALPSWSHNCIILGSSFTQIIDGGTKARCSVNSQVSLIQGVCPGRDVHGR